MKYEKPPCRGTRLMEWLHSIEASCEHFIEEWCEMFDLNQRDRKAMKKRYGERLISLNTFINFWICRNLVQAKKHSDSTRDGSHSDIQCDIARRHSDERYRMRKTKRLHVDDWNGSGDNLVACLEQVPNLD